VDTGIWYSFAFPTDPRHADAARLIQNASEPLVKHFSQFGTVAVVP
jgi:predicted nucleic acid-binding protein